ncbi:iron ABC transporter permease [Dactylosporangium sp. NPDC005572]|uniref:FecCD family ABC transporter permease n=1 Tax=Dactylosporangium sp. NPDC005572 TaxID=3156889 RepID=UPI0033BE1463
METKVATATTATRVQRRFRVLMTGSAGAVLGGTVLALGTGAVDVPVGDVVRILAAHLGGGRYGADLIGDDIVWQYRAPRALLAIVAGTGLSVAGTVLQAVVRNPLADPYVLGLASGASLGAVAVLTLGSAAVAGLSLPAAAFAGAAAALAAVLALGRRAGQLLPGRLLLAGVSIGYLASAVTSYLQLRAHPDRLAGVLFWLLGSLSGAQWSQLGIPAGCVLGGTLWLLTQARRLNALAFGDETATALGVDVARLRLRLLLVTALVTGTVIAEVGAIGFVGLLVPHLVRLLVGADHRRVLPLAALLGGGYLLLVDTAARTLARPVELPVGILTAVLGTPGLLWLLRRGDTDPAVR